MAKQDYTRIRSTEMFSYNNTVHVRGATTTTCCLQMQVPGHEREVMMQHVRSSFDPRFLSRTIY